MYYINIEFYSKEQYLFTVYEEQKKKKKITIICRSEILKSIRNLIGNILIHNRDAKKSPLYVEAINYISTIEHIFTSRNCKFIVHLTLHSKKKRVRKSVNFNFIWYELYINRIVRMAFIKKEIPR